jgi:hypothetical protein
MSYYTENSSFNNEKEDENQEDFILSPVNEDELIEGTSTFSEEYAESFGISAEIKEDKTAKDVISSEEKEVKFVKTPSISEVSDGVIGSSSAERKPKLKTKTEETKKEKVAIHSSKNVTWSGVGKVYRGYNIVDKDAAERWLTRSHIRLATPEEVKQEFGK